MLSVLVNIGVLVSRLGVRFPGPNHQNPIFRV